MSTVRFAMVVSLLAAACEPDADACEGLRGHLGETAVNWSASVGIQTEAVSGTPNDQLAILVSTYAYRLTALEEQQSGFGPQCNSTFEDVSGTATAAPGGGAPVALTPEPGGYLRHSFTGLAASYSLAFTESAGALHAVEWQPQPAFTIELQDIGDGGVRIVTTPPLSSVHKEAVEVSTCDGQTAQSYIPTIADDGTITAIYPDTGSFASMKVTLTRQQTLLYCDEPPAPTSVGCEPIAPDVYSCLEVNDSWGCQSMFSMFAFTTRRGC